jgi:FAD:protein FMN transferase
MAFDGRTMGTSYQVRFAWPRQDESLFAAAQERVAAALDSVDAHMSTFKPDSEVSLINRLAEDRPLVVSDNTMTVFAAAQEVSVATGGAFDVTVGGCVDAWGFGPGGRGRGVGDRGLASLRSAVGYEGLLLDASERSIAKTHASTRTDLSAIAKGFGVDEAALALDRLGLENYLVEVGGEVRARGWRHDGRPWHVGIEQPVPGSPRQARYAVPLRDNAMATSGDYRNCFMQGGRRYSHEIDPRTGEPIPHELTSVTVVTPRCMLADALSTALIVLGPEEGFACAMRLDIAAYFVLRQPDGGLVDRATPAFLALGGSPLAVARRPASDRG